MVNPRTPESPLQRNIKESHTFECTLLKKSNSFSGRVIPRSLQKRGRRRRILSLEIHSVESLSRRSLLQQRDSSHYEECVLRVLEPLSRQDHKASLQRGRRRQKESDEHEDYNDDDDDDDMSMSVSSTMGGPEFQDADATTAAIDIPDGWQARYRFSIQSLSIVSRHKDTVTMQIRLGVQRDTRVLVFDTEGDAMEFQTLLEQQIALESERTDEKVKSALLQTANTNTTVVADAPDTRLAFLVEIVSARELPVADIHTRSSDPFVTCALNNVILHKTDYISRTLDPIWTVETGSLFTFETTFHDLFRSSGLECVVYDYDLGSVNDTLGCVTVPPTALFEATGERVEYTLVAVAGEAQESRGSLAIRVRRASSLDLEFMNKLHDNRKKNNIMMSPKKARGVLVDEVASSSQGGMGNLRSIVSRRHRPSEHDKNVREYKVRPCPDPNRSHETKWLTDKQIQQECLGKSREWVDCGSGDIGQLYVEIIGCDGLPNLDSGGFAGNKTDSFVSLVFEDVAVKSDIIDDCLSPRWMPWTKRAFIFHMLHGSSQLFLGVFDHDDGPADPHDMVGKVSVDVTNLQRDVEYMLTYNIYTTARMTDRKRKGTITIRIRLDIHDERKLLLTTLEPPPQMYVNVKNRKDFKVVRSTIAGKYNMEKYNGKVINSFVDEILSLQNGSYYAFDALTTLVLWRGTFPVVCGGLSFSLPIHSVAVFVGGAVVVEYPELLPSAFFASISWVLLASTTYRQGLPDVWDRCKSFHQWAEAALLGRSQTRKTVIAPFENESETREYLERWSKRIAQAEAEAAQKYEEQLEAQRANQNELEDGEFDNDISTSGSSVSVDPFKPFLYPVQKGLGVLCRYIRYVKNVITWQDGPMAFWTTIGCLILSLLCLFVPWFFLIKWSARLIVWTVFGPWMKLVDVFIIKKMKPLSAQELEERRRTFLKQLEERSFVAAATARVKRENHVKLKAMKKFMFGEFIVKVPILKMDRYRDLPTRSSHAKPHTNKQVPMSELAMMDVGYCRKRIQGQHLVGDMIPHVEMTRFTEAPVGQPTTRPSQIDLTGIQGFNLFADDSTLAAYRRLGSVVVAAAVMTWFGVPLLAATAEKALSNMQ